LYLPLAYIDPGSGSLIIQVVIASIVAIPIFFRAQLARAVALFRHPAKETDAAAPEPTGAAVAGSTDPGESA
jgi:hypothetical protein